MFASSHSLCLASAWKVCFSFSMAIFIFLNVPTKSKFEQASVKCGKPNNAPLFIHNLSPFICFSWPFFTLEGKSHAKGPAGGRRTVSHWAAHFVWSVGNEKAKRTTFRHSSTRHELLCRPLMQRCFLWSILPLMFSDFVFVVSFFASLRRCFFLFN